MNWQPIETAPRDGTNILIYQESIGEMHVVCFEGKKDGSAVWIIARTEQGNTVITHEENTHWMPLPDPPNG